METIDAVLEAVRHRSVTAGPGREPSGTPEPSRPAGVVPDAVRGLPLGVLEDRLTGLAARIAVTECEFLDLLGEFDARDGWGESGLRSSAHWLSWRVGLSLGAARDRVRVARALRRLPRVRAAFAAGSLSYCKVRALCRVATGATEAELVEVARGATGAQLETVVRSWRRMLLGRSAASAQVRRGVRRREEEDGTVVYTVRVPPAEAAATDRALALAGRVVLDEQGRLVETPEEAAMAEWLDGETAAVRSRADAFMVMVESFLAGGPTGEAGDAYLVMVHADLDALAAACLEAADGCGNVSAETSRRPSEARAGQVPEGGSVHQASRACRPATCNTEDGQPLSASTVLRMLCQSPAQLLVSARDGHTLDLGRTSRNADRRQRRAIRARDGGHCRFPGCTQRGRLVPHHSHWWSRGGPTDLDLLVSLCPTHHLSVHELGYGVRALGHGRFAWSRPDGRPIPDVPPPGEGPLDPAVGDCPDQATAIVPTWGGEHIDLDHLLGGMAANLINSTGLRLTDIPGVELDDALRRAAGWQPAAARKPAA